MIRKSLMISVVTLALFHTVPAFAQYDGESNARIKRLETELETLSRAIYKGEAPPPGMMAQGDAAKLFGDAEPVSERWEYTSADGELNDLSGRESLARWRRCNGFYASRALGVFPSSAGRRG